MRLLAFRFSAMGDVALTVPALRAVLRQNRDLEIVLATRKTFIPFFEEIPRLTLFTPDLNKYKGLTGLYHLYRKMKKLGDFDAVADLHDVFRTKVIRFFFHLSGVTVYRIDKGRREKRLLVKGKRFRPLKHTVERYMDVFRQAQLKTRSIQGPHIRIPKQLRQEALLPPQTSGYKIGVAPCTRHKLKSWPVTNMIRLMQLIREKYQVSFFLFGGPEDKVTLEKIASTVGKTVSLLPLERSLDHQLALMQQMDWMISMDSANMHLASLTGIPVISIWGATHPYAGFAPWGTDEKYQVQIPKEELPCRPCTIYGKGTCRRHDLACLHRITPEMVMERILETRLLH